MPGENIGTYPWGYLRRILYGWDSGAAQGWFLGTVHSRGLSPRDLRTTPSANYVVKYKPAETERRLNGAVACELSERLYGAGAWWVVLEAI